MHLLLDETPHLPNPNLTRISDATWRFWCCYVRRVPGAKLGGVYAPKTGYHNYRDALPTWDYSAGRDVAADKRGSGAIADGIDLTLPEDQMKLQTRRLDAAARSRDKRLYVHGGPTMREFIGTKDGSTVYCWVFTGGAALGVTGPDGTASDSGPDPGRDVSHLWHIHNSWIRQYGNDRKALDGVLSVMIGESPAAYAERMEENDLGSITDPKQLQQFNDMAYTTTAAINDPRGSAGSVPHHVWAEWMTGVVQQMWNAIQAMATQLPDVDNQVAANMNTQLTQLQAQLDERLAQMQAQVAEAAEITPAEAVSVLTAGDMADGAQLLFDSVSEQRAVQFRDALTALIEAQG